MVRNIYIVYIMVRLVGVYMKKRERELEEDYSAVKTKVADPEQFFLHCKWSDPIFESASIRY